MKLETFVYTKDDGWSIKDFPLMDSNKTLVLVFASPEMVDDPKPLSDLKKHYPTSIIIGCSSSGEIMGSHILDHSVSVAVAQFENTPLKLVLTEITKKEDSYNVGCTIAKALNATDLNSIFILAEGMIVNGTELTNGLNAEKVEKVTITGGLAGDGDRFNKTWIICNGDIYHNHIVAVGFYGSAIQVNFSSKGGWNTFGPERYVTRSKGNILYELDGCPALSLYKDYLGEKSKGLPATGLFFPLGIRKNEPDSKWIVRTIQVVDEDNQSLTFGGDIPTGYFATLMRANFDSLITSAGEAGEETTEKIKVNHHEKPLLSIAVSCVGRRLILGEQTEEEIELMLQNLPKETQQVGFYSYGELSSNALGQCDLHNQTMTLTTFHEI